MPSISGESNSDLEGTLELSEKIEALFLLSRSIYLYTKFSWARICLEA
jgi:hypothetical protein